MLEIIVETLQDAIKSEQGGADQLDVKKDTDNGGMTPSVNTVKAILDAVGVSVMVTVRPRLGDFVYTAEEIKHMIAGIRQFNALGVDAFLLGALNPDKTINEEAIKQCLNAAGDKAVHVHLCWEETPNPKQTLTKLMNLGVKSVRITGGIGLGDKAISNVAALNAYRKIAVNKIELVLAGGVNADNLRKLMVETGIHHAHVGSGVRTPSTPNGELKVEKVRVLKHIQDTIGNK